MKTIGKRAVAFLDLLGFKKMIETLSAEEIGDKYERLINLIGHLNAWYSDEKGLCEQFIFSDSIILIAKDDSENSFINLFTYAWRILQTSIALKMPIRGAIAYDDVYINRSLNVFLGKGLTKAYELETIQDWIGILVDDEVIERYHGIFSRGELSEIYEAILFQYDVPIKGGKKISYRTINWRFNLVVDIGTMALLKTSDDPSVQTKFNNTIEYASKVKEAGKLYTSGEGIPIEYRVFWVGATEPPFKHGDNY